MSEYLPKQLPLELSHEVALGMEDFLIGSSNRAAYDLVETWPNWASEVVVLVGPVGSGKTHLVRAFQEEIQAVCIEIDQLSIDDMDELLTAPAIILENAHQSFDNTALFHLLNAARQEKKKILITSRTWPASWSIGLPDLASRLRAATTVEIQEPDDELLRRVFVKLFADRQLDIDLSVIDYLVLRMERSLGQALEMVEALDGEALAERHKITKSLARRVLERTSAS